MDKVWRCRSERLRIYSRVVYGISRILRYGSFEYEVGDGRRPDRISYIGQSQISKAHSFLLALILDLYVLYTYGEAFFGKATNVEFSVAVAMNSVWLALNAAQWCHISDFHRDGGINLSNLILKMQFHIPQNPLLACELLYFATLSAATTGLLISHAFPFFVSWYLPGIHRLLTRGTDLLTALAFGKGNWWGSFLIRNGILALIGRSIGDSLYHKSIQCQWLYSFLFTMTQHVQGMLGTGATTNDDPAFKLKSFFHVKVAFATYVQVYNLYFASNTANFIVSLIYIIFLLICPAEIPLMVTLTLLLALFTFLVAGYLQFQYAIELHLSSLQLIQTNKERCRRDDALYEYKVWKSMLPPRPTFLGMCSFETRGLILIIWADVVATNVINLLLAF